MSKTNQVLLVTAAVAIGAAVAMLALLVFRALMPAPETTPAPITQAAPPPTSPPIDAPGVPQNAPASAPAAPAVDAGLQQLLEAEAKAIRGTVSIHLRVDGAGVAGVDPDTPMTAASVIKVPIMVAVERAWHDGTLQRTDKDAERMRAMITRSDNPSADALIDRVGMSQINDWLKEHGYTATRLRHRMAGPRPDGPNTVSAAEMTRMLMEIARGELVDVGASTEMRTLLIDAQLRSRIPAGLPDDAVVGNKTGTLNGVVNDTAFVETPGGVRYTIAVLVSRAPGDAPTSKAIAALSAKVYEYLASAMDAQTAPHPEAPANQPPAPPGNSAPSGTASPSEDSALPPR